MTFDWMYIALAIVCAGTVTVVLRALPFAVRRVIRNSHLLVDLNQWMPLGITVILVVYCLTAIDPHQIPLALAELAGIVATILAHWWRRNIFISLTAGTGTCVILANWILPAFGFAS